LPDNARAVEHWLSLREELLRLGFYQTSLTNFERASFRERPERYRYEECSFRPDRYNVAGFGPSATSYSATQNFQHGIKTMNPTASVDYLAAVKTGKRVWNKMFVYRPLDQFVFWLTRRLADLYIDRGVSRKLFSIDPAIDFAEEFAAMADAELVEITAEAIRPTPKGMFYADSIAALFASRAIRVNRDLGSAVIGGDVPKELLHDTRENDARPHGMG